MKNSEAVIFRTLGADEKNRRGPKMILPSTSTQASSFLLTVSSILQYPRAAQRSGSAAARSAVRCNRLLDGLTRQKTHYGLRVNHLRTFEVEYLREITNELCHIISRVQFSTLVLPCLWRQVGETRAASQAWDEDQFQRMGRSHLVVQPGAADALGCQQRQHNLRISEMLHDAGGHHVPASNPMTWPRCADDLH